MKNEQGSKLWDTCLCRIAMCGRAGRGGGTGAVAVAAPQAVAVEKVGRRAR